MFMLLLLVPTDRCRLFLVLSGLMWLDCAMHSQDFHEA